MLTSEGGQKPYDAKERYNSQPASADAFGLANVLQRQIYGSRSPVILDFTRAQHTHASPAQGGQLGTDALTDSSITTAKIADDAVTAAKLVGIDKSNLTTDSNPYKFSVYLNADQTGISDAVATKITWDTELFDTNANFASNKYTAPVNGFYMINAYVLATSTNNAGVAMTCSLYKNGSSFLVGHSGYITFNVGASPILSARVHDIIQLTAGDYLEVYVTMDVVGGTVTVEGTADSSRFNGFLVCRT